MAVKKATKTLAVVTHASGLKVRSDGHFVIKTKDDALRAVQYAGTILEKIEKIKRDQLAELETNYKFLREDLRDFQNGAELAEVVSNDFRSDLVERTGSMWIMTDADIPDASKLPVSDREKEIKSLFSILAELSGDNRKMFTKLWNRVTKRVLDPDGIDLAVKEGLLTIEQISPAFLDFVQTSYVMIKEKK